MHSGEPFFSCILVQYNMAGKNGAHFLTFRSPNSLMAHITTANPIFNIIVFLKYTENFYKLWGLYEPPKSHI